MNNLEQFSVVAIRVTDLKKIKGGFAFGGLVVFASCMAFAYLAATGYAMTQVQIRAVADAQNLAGKEQSQLVGSLTILNF